MSVDLLASIRHARLIVTSALSDRMALNMEGPSVFISYSREDARTAKKLQSAIQAASFQPWSDIAGVQLDWTAEIAQALVRCHIVCLLWTNRSAKSGWVKHEWLTARALEKHIVPVVERGSPPLPEPLRHIQSLSIDDLGRKMQERLQACLASPPRYDFTVVPAGTHIPYLPDPNFTGRAEDLVKLYLGLLGGLQKIGLSQLGAVGFGGVGKTQLAVEFAYRFSFAFEAVFWLDAADPANWLRQFVGIARDRLRLGVADPAGPEAFTQYVAALSAHLSHSPKTLIVMDNVQAPELLASEQPLSGTGLTPLSLGGNLLFTTRRRFFIPGVSSQSINVLDSDAAFHVLTARRPPDSSAETESARTICAAVGRLPLALAVIGSAVLKRRLSYAEYLSRLAEGGLAAIDSQVLSPAELATRHATAIQTTLEYQWNTVDSEGSRLLLCLTCRMPQASAIPKARLALMSQPGTDLDGALALLLDLSLVSEMESARRLRVHPLVREFARARLSKERSAALVGDAVSAMSSALRDPARIEREIQERGVDELIDDLEIALDMADGTDCPTGAMKQLKTLLDREQSHLKGIVDPSQSEIERETSGKEIRISWRERLRWLFWAPTQIEEPAPSTAHPSPLPTCILLQLQNRAQKMALDELSLSCRELAIARGTPSLITYGSSAQEDPALIRKFTAHAAPVIQAVMSSDGRNILSASGDRTLVWWDVETGRAIRRLSGHSDAVSGCALFPDGRHAISSSADKTLIVWDLQTGKALRSLAGHKDCVNTVAVSPSGEIAIGGSDDRTLIVWDLQTGRRLRTLEGHEERVTCVAIHPDGRTAVSGSDEKKLILWDLTTGGVIGRLTGGFITPDEGDTLQLFLSHDARITDVAWIPDANRVISCSFDKSLIVWDVASRKPIRKLAGHDDWINCVWISPDGARAISGGWDSIIVWDVERGAAIHRFRQSGVGSVQCSPDGKWLVTGADDQSVSLWDLKETRQHHHQGHRNWVTALGISVGGSRAVSGSDDEQLIVWDAASGYPVGNLRKIEHANPDGQNALALLQAGTDGPPQGGTGDSRGSKAMRSSVAALTRDGRRAVTAGWDLVAMIWDLETTSLLGHFAHGRLFVAGALSDDGQRAILAHDRTLSVWKVEYHKIGDTAEVALGELEASLRDPAGDLMSAAITPGGGHAVTGGETGGMTFWDLARRTVIRSGRAHRATIGAVAMRADGRRVLTGSFDTTMKLWDSETGEALQMFVGHHLPVSGVAFLEDENLVVSASYDRSVVIWDVRTGASVSRLITQLSVFSLAVAGNRLLFGDAEGSVHFLEVVGVHPKTGSHRGAGSPDLGADLGSRRIAQGRDESAGPAEGARLSHGSFREMAPSQRVAEPPDSKADSAKKRVLYCSACLYSGWTLSDGTHCPKCGRRIAG
jgi:WD40 repeat protein